MERRIKSSSLISLYQLLHDDYKARIEASLKLEQACSKILRSATRTWRSARKVALKAHKKALKVQHKSKGMDVEKQDPDEFTFEKPMPTKEALLDLVPIEKLPTHREGKIPLIGKKVNTFEHCKDEIRRLNVDIPPLQQKWQEGKPLGAVFIECNLQIGAHVLAQVVAYHEVLSSLSQAKPS